MIGKTPMIWYRSMVNSITSKLMAHCMKPIRWIWTQIYKGRFAGRNTRVMDGYLWTVENGTLYKTNIKNYGLAANWVIQVILKNTVAMVADRVTSGV